MFARGCRHAIPTRIIAGVMKIPLFPLDVVLFPGAALPLHIFEDRYKEMVAGCVDRDEPFGIVRAQIEGLAVIGCTAKIVKVLQRYPDGRLDILCEGGDRFEIELLDNSRAYLQAEIDDFLDDVPASTRAEREQCTGLHFEVMELIGAHDDRSTPLHFAIDLDKPISISSRICSAPAPTPSERKSSSTFTMPCCPGCAAEFAPARRPSTTAT
jgi:Lon protease-like protein